LKPITEQSLYEILEIPRDAAGEEIEKAYQRAKALYGPGSLATYSLVAPEEMNLLDRRIEEARRVLLDPGARAGYDAALPAGAEGIGRVPVARSPASKPGPAPGAAPVPATPATAARGAQAPAAGAAAPRQPGFTVPEGTPWTGEVLRQAREARGLTLNQIAERTKVTRHHLENIEADRYQLLPPPVYLRGILMSLAKELRLDGQKVARSYLEAVQAAEAQKAPPKPH
jgi:curved DNA-binding protein CbpA